MRYELTDLKLFVAIANARSLSTGAASVHITASSASYRLKNLEQALGVSLFYRGAKGMTLTSAGELVLAHATEIFDGLERMGNGLRSFAAREKRRVRVTANSLALKTLVTPSIGRFLAANPNVDVELVDRRSEEIPSAVLRHEADLGIFAGAAYVEGLEIIPYAVDERVLVVPADHSLARHQEVSLACTLGFDYVCLSRSSSNFLFLNEMAQAAGRRLRARVHVDSFETLLALVESSVGIALIPRSSLGPSTKLSNHVVVRFAESWAIRNLNIAVRDDHASSLVAELMNFLRNDLATRRLLEPAETLVPVEA